MSTSRRELKTVILKQNFIDKFAAVVSPRWAYNRFRASASMAIGKAYAGASKTRRALSEWITSSGDANTDSLFDLNELRIRSRDLSRNTPIATGAISTKVTNVIGSGLKVQPRIDGKYLGLSEDEASEWERAAEREFSLFADTHECDLERTSNFYELQSIVFRSMLESGDIFAMLPMIKRRGSPYSTKIQLIEADRVSNPNRAADTAQIAGGIETDKYGAPEFVHICKGHPGSLINFKNMKWDKFRVFGQSTGRRNVLHVYKKLRPGQSRGIPDLAPVIEIIKQLGRYTQNEVDSAVISSMFTVFVKSEFGAGLGNMDPTDETGAKDSDKDFKMSGGAILDLRAGEDVEFANPARPNAQFDQFILAATRMIGAALELPFEILIKHFTKSYSAARAAFLEAFRYFMVCRNGQIFQFSQPVYEAVITEAIARGRLTAPGYLSGDPLIKKSYLGSIWVGPARGQIDPTKENAADGDAEDRGWKTGAMNSAERGTNWEDNNTQLQKEKRLRGGGENTSNNSSFDDDPDKKDKDEELENN